MAEDKTNQGIFNPYTINPRNLNNYTAFRGITDYTQIGQFDQYESGYQFLHVLQMPKFLTVDGVSEKVREITQSFKHMLEYEFRGLDGLPDLTGDTYEITDGINTQRIINKVTRETSVTVSSSYFERRGGLISKFSEYYLTGIKDPYTQAKTYHGLIKNGILAPSLENEVFTMLYYATDNTMLRIERAFLLCNCQLTKAENIWNGSRDNISNKELAIEWNCFPVVGRQVDMAAKVLLQDITGIKINKTTNAPVESDYLGGDDSSNPLDSANYEFGILKDRSSYPNIMSPNVPELPDAISKANS